MATRIYIVEQAGTVRLIRAATQSAARNFVAKDSISVEVASPTDTYEYALKGAKVEEASAEPAQLEIGEAA